jgi:hypothetical protein
MRLTLDIEAAAGTIVGSVSDEHGASVEFGGWLGLAGALDRLLRDDEAAPAAPLEREVA